MNLSRINVNHEWVHNLWLAVFSAMLVLAFVPKQAASQEYRAKLTAVVTDSTGAIVPNAKLELKRGSTNQVTTGITDAGGSYIFQLLEPDTYSLQVSAPTFNTSEVTGIVIQAYASTSVPVVLKPASATAEVTVTAEGALLQTDTAAQSWVVPAEQTKDLPVANLNPMMIGADLPGVYMRPLGIYTDPWTITSQYLVNGGLMYLNEFWFNGSPNDSEIGANTYAYTPPEYSVKQFTVSTDDYDAQYGHTSGGVIDEEAMSGGSGLHGIGWSSLRRTGWNANTYQNKYENAINDTNANGTPFNTQTQVGFQVGGPIYLPHLVRPTARYKPYFFFAFDHYSELLPRGLLVSYPTAKMRTGDFSELLPYGVTINDPATVHQDTDPTSPTYGDYIRNPFPGNIIPPGRLDPVAQAISKVFPTVGASPSGQRPGTEDLNLPNNYYNWHFRNFLGRFDFDIGDKYKFYLSPYYNKFTEVSNAGGIIGVGENGGTFARIPKGFLVDFIDTLNPTTVLNVRYGYDRFHIPWTAGANSGVNLASYGFPANFISSLQQPQFMPNFDFQNYNAIGWFANTEDTGTYTIEGDLAKTRGNHSLRVGWDVRLTHFVLNYPGFPTFTSNSDWTDSNFNNIGSEATSGDSYATFLLGTPSTGSTTIWNGNYGIVTWYIAPWVQDDWKVSRSVTLNIGFRYDVNVAPVDQRNRLDVGFDPEIPNAVQSQITPAAIAALPQASNLTGGLLFAGVGGNLRSPFPTTYGDIQPRFGLEWQVRNRLVVRGGYGLFYTNYLTNNFIQQLGFTANDPLVTSNNGGITPIPNVLDNPYPNGLAQPTGSSLGTLTGLGTSLSTFNRNYKIPKANQFSLGIQYSPVRNGVVDISYVGNRIVGFDSDQGGQNLPSGYQTGASDANLPSWSFQQQCDEIYAQGNYSLCQATATNPFQGISAFKGTGYYTASTYDVYDLNRPHPEFLAVVAHGLNTGRSWYNGLQAAFTQQMTHGITFGASYTWSKQITQWGWLNQALNIPQRSQYINGLPQVFKVHGLFELPVGRGKLLNVQNKIADEVVGGWEFAPDFSVQSGEPAALPQNAIPLKGNKFYKPNWSQNTVRAWNGCVLDYVPGGAPTIPGGATGVTAQQCGTDPSTYGWLYVQTLPYESANPYLSDKVRMKPTITSDAALQKTFQIHESITATARLQATNVLNHFNILTAKFDTNPNDPPNLFGTINKGVNVPTSDAPPRNVNVQFRVNW
jgi:hypothetical protein